MSAFANRFELRCEPKQHDDIVLQNLPLLFILYSGNTITKNWISLALFFISSIKDFANTRYSLHYLQNTLRYNKYNTTRSKISCLPRGFRKKKEREGKKARLRRTILKKKIH